MSTGALAQTDAERIERALMAAPRLGDNSQVESALASAGIDMARLHRDLIARRAAIDQLLMRNDAEARGLGLRGAAGFIRARSSLDRVLERR